MTRRLPFDVDRLRHLYLVERKTQAQIGEVLGVNQVQVSRFLKQAGIKALSRTDRVSDDLPKLTGQQEQLLTGSLLGDGWMDPTCPESARFCETHCLEQEPYLNWKSRILAPFSHASYPTSKTKEGKTFQGQGFATVSCRQLRPWYDLFYPVSSGEKVFPSDLSDRMTPFVFAVWYMDDGGVTSRGEPRISYGLGKVSLDRACRALQHLGLNAVCYGDGGDQSIHFPKQAGIIQNLIEPYLIPCMGYKLPRVRAVPTRIQNMRVP